MPEPIRDVSEADFERDVVERSRAVPVVVDFWAAWCGPCRALGPVLEQAVAARGGKVELAKLDVDANQGLSAQFGVRGIPAVKAFVGGKVAAEFEGARDRRFVEHWLDALVPSEAKQQLARADALAAASPAEAEKLLTPLADDAEVGSAAALRLAQLALARGAPEEAQAFAAKVSPRSEEYAKVEGLERRIGLAREAKAYGGEEKARAALAQNDGDLEARYALAAALAVKGEAAQAAEELLEVLARDRKYRGGAARLSLLALLEALGPASDEARALRRRMQAVL